MSNWLQSLQNDNFKLKAEAKLLKESLKLASRYKYLRRNTNDIKEKIQSLTNGKNNKLLNHSTQLLSKELYNPYKNSDKENIRDAKILQKNKELEKNSENTSKNFQSFEKSTKNLQNFEKSTTNPENSNLKNSKIISKNKKKSDSLNFSMQKPSKNRKNLKNSLINAEYQKKPSKSENFLDSNLKSPQFTKKNNPERSLLDSLNSYYESEEENLDKNGKCELSYKKYKKYHEKGTRRRTKSNLSLNSKNDQVKFFNFLKKQQKSRNSLSLRKNSEICEIFKDKQENCSRCDYLLHEGYSSINCNKHTLKD